MRRAISRVKTGALLRLVSTLIESLIRNVGGPLGIRLRRAWYGHRLKACGEGLVVEVGVSIVGAGHISLGDHVWIDRNSVLIAGPPRPEARIVEARCPGDAVAEGEISIGGHSHLGIGTIIQGHGGVAVGPCFTCSAGVKIYSFSADYRTCRFGTVGYGGEADEYAPGFRVTPVVIGRNVWLGLNVSMIGHRIGDDSFALPGSVLTTDVPPNSVVAGAPARRIRARFEEIAS